METSTRTKLLYISPVLPTADMDRDISWYEAHTQFRKVFGDHMYAGLRWGDLEIHLQWHADTPDDPLLGGSVIRIFVEDIVPIFEDLVAKGTVGKEKLRMNTAWGTNEFGFFDPNKNAVFLVERL